jgi:hypothetical protein
MTPGTGRSSAAPFRMSDSTISVHTYLDLCSLPGEESVQLLLQNEFAVEDGEGGFVLDNHEP